MSSSPERAPGRRVARACAALLALGTTAAALAAGDATEYPGIGRAATAGELRAWDIDVRPDFKGLPEGSGSVAKGMEVWDAKCASCHGTFGESNQVFFPIVGGTTVDDIRSGRVARLTDPAYPGRTTLMKVPTLSTLWDYIRRAMPWNAPKSLSTEEVYAVTAYILNLGGILPDDFVLSSRNVAAVQQRMPNRNGMTTDHALWPGAGLGRARPDTRNVACMRDCGPEPRIASALPEHARDAHGDLAQQNRGVGAQHGADTAPAKPPGITAPVAAATGGTASVAATAAIALATKHACTACHGVENRIVGPGFREVAQRYAGRADATAQLAEKIRSGGSGNWGAIPMPPQSLDDAEAKVIAQWLADGARSGAP